MNGKENSDIDGGKLERQVGATVVRNLNLLVSLIVACAVFWTQANMVSKTELKAAESKIEQMREELTRTRMDLLTIPKWDRRLDDIESRLKDLEKSDKRRFPPPRE